MADHKREECTSAKRARLSSDCHPDRNDSSTRCLDIEERRELAISLNTKNEEGVFNQTSSVHVGSREHHGGVAIHERLESEDFPTCFSVEDDIDDNDEHRYQPIAGPMGWVQRQMTLGINPEDILSYMVPHAQLPCSLDKTTLWKIIIDILTEPSPRQKLDHINTLDDVLELLKGSKNIIVLTGAGVSVSCGIPDFRSRDGIYARLSVEYPDLPDPQAMFDISYFYQNPRPFFKFAKEIYPGQFKPSLSHRFIQQLESNDQLLRNYTQNIDTLEQVAGITRVIQCHGSFSTASCTNCKYQVSSDAIKEDIFNQVIPLCRKCTQAEGLAIMKPDIVFFGESLPSEFYHQLDEDSEKVDLLIVIGSSLKVRPVALIPSHLPPEVPQILINREPLRQMTFDIELLGDCDVIVSELCQRLGGKWKDLLEEFEIPCVKKKVSFAEEPTFFAGSSDPKESNRPQNEQTPQTKSEDSEAVDRTPHNSQQSTEEAACQPDAARSLECRVTAVETTSINSSSSSSSKVTEDDTCHDQPQACASSEDTSHSNESAGFYFMPPSRYIFSGAEVVDSPLPSPTRGKVPYLDSSDSDSDSVGEIDDDKPLCKESIRRSSEGSFCSNSDDGFGEGESEVIHGDKTRQALSLILGELSAYTCESEGNSRMSASDDLPPPAPVPSHSVASAPEAATTMSSVTRPFSAVDMGGVLVKGEESESGSPSGHNQDYHASRTSKDKHIKFADDHSDA